MPYVVDVPLQDGKFTARVHSRPSGGQVQEITRDTRKRVKEDNMSEVLFDNLLTLCEGWDVTDEDGSPIPWGREGLRNAPFDILDELSTKAQEFLQHGKTIDQRLKEIAEEMDEDDPRHDKLLELVDSGN